MEMDIGTDSWVLSICHIIWPWDEFVEYSAAYSEMCCNTHCRSCHSCIVSAVDQVIRKAMALGFVDQACREESLLRSFDRIPVLRGVVRYSIYDRLLQRPVCIAALVLHTRKSLLLFPGSLRRGSHIPRPHIQDD